MQSLSSLTVDFSVKFNWDVGSNVYYSATTSSAINDIVCDMNTVSDSNVPAAAGYTTTGSTVITTTVGVALDGVLMFEGVSLNYVDPFYPNGWTSTTTGAHTTASAEHVDLCLGHPQATGMYHYHMLPPCLFDSTYAATAGACDPTAACSSSPKAYALAGYTN
jgi:hypothetical protein